MPSITDLDFLLRRPSRCEQAANRVRVAKDVELPVLKDWNYSPCLEHELWEDDEGTVHRDKPKPGCRRCAIVPRDYQRVGAMWMLLKKKALLADGTGLGKSCQIGLTIAMVHELGEMSRKRVLVICRAPAVLQHVQELRRMMPGLNITAAIGPKKKRQITYAQRWDVLVIGQQMVLSDEEYLSQFDFAAIFADDVDAIRNRRTKTSQTWRTLTATCPRVYVVSATPLQKRLPEMYAVTEQIGGREIFGSEWAFKSRYLQTQSQVIRVQGGNRRQVQKEVGVRNMAQPLDSKILTPTGWVEMGDLSVGDPLVDPCGEPSVVEKVFPRGTLEVYRLKFSDGTSCESTLDHLWKVRFSNKDGDDWIVSTLEDLIPELGKRKNIALHPLRVPVPGQTVESLLDPYILGAFLGDGSSATGTPSFVSMDEEIVARVAERLPQGFQASLVSGGYGTGRAETYQLIPTDTNTRPKDCGRCLLVFGEPQTSEYAGRGLCRSCYSKLWHGGNIDQFPVREKNVITSALRFEGIWGKKSFEKFVPERWLRSDVSQRTALLQGLLDTDGTVDRGRGIAWYISTSQQLAEDVAYLARSLGMRATTYPWNSPSRLANNYRPAWRVRILWSEGLPLPFHLSRKASLVQSKSTAVKNLQEIVFSREAPVQCIKVSASSSLYVTDGFTVTHNSEFRQKVGPLVLRRTAADVDGVDMPDIIPNDVFLELHPGQRAKYKELQQGILKIVKEGKVAEVKHAEAMAKFIYGAQICSGLATIGEDDGPGASIKLDWAMEQITGDFAEDKIVVFSASKNGVRALQSRLAAEGIGYVTIWGEDRDAISRMQSQEKFWNDDRCRVLIGTTAIEQSLNLQVARHLINVDLVMNQARMTQLAGRIARVGSAHKTVYVHNLLTVETQEERYLPILEQEAAMVSSLFGTQSELFAPLSAGQLLNLIAE